MVRLMRLGSLQAGLITGVGLSEIEPGVAGLQAMPMVFHDLDELEYATEKLSPMLEKRLADKGFVVLFWGDAGWVRYFSTKPMVRRDLKKNKVFVWAGNPDQVDIMKRAGYNPSRSRPPTCPRADHGLITAVGVPPIVALVSGFDKRAPHMIDLNWAPMIGACVIKKSVWDKLTPATGSDAQGRRRAGSRSRRTTDGRPTKRGS
jgi:TRAP-type C4-dicarboxylate transport system substrate-binding protein